jgi:adenine-specific DNA-methyltransferase
MLTARPSQSQLAYRSSGYDRDLPQPVCSAIEALPPTRFYGSKRKLLPWIYSNVAHLKFETALDLFGGSASVSLLFKIMQKSVVYHDGFRFNEDVGRTLLATQIPMSRPDLVLFLNSILPQTGFISTMFEGIFYTNEENRWLDGFLTQLSEYGLSPTRTSLLRYLLYQACLKKRPFNLFHRANLGLRTNGAVKRSFGNLVTWERSFGLHMLQAYDELLHNSASRGPEGTVLPSQNVENIPAGYDLVYIDPPYISSSEGRNWDNYWRRYHFLEGLARYQEWEQLIDPHSNIRLLAQPEWISPWSHRGTFAERLFSLVEKHRDSIVVLSYVSDAYPRDDEIKAFFRSQFTSTVFDAKIHTHALSPSAKTELLFIGWSK